MDYCTPLEVVDPMTTAGEETAGAKDEGIAKESSIAIPYERQGSLFLYHWAKYFAF